LVAHFNHRIRGNAADADQAWLESLCRQLDVLLTTGRPEPAAAQNLMGSFTSGEGSSEGSLRAARYHFLRETAEQLGARFVAVAHTADDQVETVLHRLLRGTGLEGLSGMTASRPLSPTIALVRPLLAVSRATVREYLGEIGQDYRVDETNADTRWTRNRLRHELLPLLRERYNPSVDDALLRLSVQARESQQTIIGIADELARSSLTVEHPQRSLEPAASCLRIDCRRLTGATPLVVREVCRIAWRQAGWPLQAMGVDAWQKLAMLALTLDAPPIVLPGNIRASRQTDYVVLEALG
jgi:tRNA(Ile)-lysidine synthase